MPNPASIEHDEYFWFSKRSGYGPTINFGFGTIRDTTGADARSVENVHRQSIR